MSIVASRYAEAIFELALEENSVEQTYEACKEIRRIFQNEEDLTEFLSHPQIEVEDKVKLIKETFNEVTQSVINLMCVMVEKKRSKNIVETFDEFEELYFNYKNIVKATVYTAVSLSDEMLEKVKQLIEMKTSSKVYLDIVVDKTIIGGIKFQVGNHIYDGTVSSELFEIKKELHKIQLK